ncbi:hypothetical protein B0H12DRAFT_308132 [Mycena haematopus]|nr:hypothetical protein B0H12DRAFT_308132 [Mycena haematopus]
MLFLLVLVHLLSRNGSAAPVPHSLNLQIPVDSCDDFDNCRKLFILIWRCIVTIAACTWVSVHPNVPPPNQSWWAHFWRRLKMMLSAIIGPEVMVGFAARQYFGARHLSKGAEYGFSNTHAFFFCMGGFVSQAGHPIATVQQLDNPRFGRKYQEAIRSVHEADIKDKSKGDALTKGLALVQVLWFITQFLVRINQHLVVTELELATLGFAMINIFIWGLWWDKPLRAERQIVIGSSEERESINRAPLTALAHCVLMISGFMGDAKYDPLSTTSVPSFWSLPLDDGFSLRVFGITALVGSAFGAIHCAAWNALFPTIIEMWLWRFSSLVILALPPILLLLAWILYMLRKSRLKDTWFGKAIWAISWTFIHGCVPIYVSARLVLVVLPFMVLRTILPSAYEVVEWTEFIPHLNL